MVVPIDVMTYFISSLARGGPFLKKNNCLFSYKNLVSSSGGITGCVPVIRLSQKNKILCTRHLGFRFSFLTLDMCVILDDFLAPEIALQSRTRLAQLLYIQNYNPTLRKTLEELLPVLESFFWVLILFFLKEFSFPMLHFFSFLIILFIRKEREYGRKRI